MERGGGRAIASMNCIAGQWLPGTSMEESMPNQQNNNRDRNSQTNTPKSSDQGQNRNAQPSSGRRDEQRSPSSAQPGQNKGTTSSERTSSGKSMPATEEDDE